MTEKPESSKHPTQRVRKTEEDPDAPSAAAGAASLNLLKMGRPVSELRLGIHGLTTAELEQRVREVLHSLEIIPNDSRMQYTGPKKLDHDFSSKRCYDRSRLRRIAWERKGDGSRRV